jgi:ArsR family transcriptional regulator, arsenate/arsenite/antimonite-responsive transcriptional repressor
LICDLIIFIFRQLTKRGMLFMKPTVRVFKALADVNRLRILKMLQAKPLCVCEITSILKLAPSTVSKHLAVLRDAGLIADSKDSKWVNYRIASHAVSSAAHEALSLVRRILQDDATVEADRKAATAADRNRICGNASACADQVKKKGVS